MISPILLFLMIGFLIQIVRKKYDIEIGLDVEMRDERLGDALWITIAKAWVGGIGRVLVAVYIEVSLTSTVILHSLVMGVAILY